MLRVVGVCINNGVHVLFFLVGLLLDLICQHRFCSGKQLNFDIFPQQLVFFFSCTDKGHTLYCGFSFTYMYRVIGFDRSHCVPRPPPPPPAPQILCIDQAVLITTANRNKSAKSGHTLVPTVST